MHLALDLITAAGTLILIVLGLALILGLMDVVNLAHTGFMAVGVCLPVSVWQTGVNVWLAVMANDPLAQGVGINTTRVRQITFVLGAALAGAAGASLGPLQSINPNFGVTMVLIEHDLAFVMRIADRIAVLHDGRVIECGPPDVVAHSPVVGEAYVGVRQED